MGLGKIRYNSPFNVGLSSYISAAAYINVLPRFSIFLRLAVVTSATSSTETPLTSARHCATSATCRGSVQLWRYFLKGCGNASVSSTMFSSGMARAASCTSSSRVSGRASEM